MLTIDGKYTSALVTTDKLDEMSAGQIMKLTNHPSFTNPIVMMPDIHAGAGSPIGFTMKLTNSVVCSVVGVDIGCGMLATKLSGLPVKDPEKLDQDIRNIIPFSTNVRLDDQNILVDGDPFFKQVQSSLNRLWAKLRTEFGVGVPSPPEVNYSWYMDKCTEIGMDFGRAQRSIGTLGGGNHFIELGVSSYENPDQQSPDRTISNTWIIVHSGSRQFGKLICDHHQHIAIAQLKEFREGKYKEAIESIRKTSHPREMETKIKAFKAESADRIKIPRGMEPLLGHHMYNYLYDMIFAQHYASLNRVKILGDILKLIENKPLPHKTPRRRMLPFRDKPPLETIETIHNYISPEDLIVRKGAVSSQQGEKIVIPFNMRDGTWICIGTGNKVWNYSAPHGAGRTMSRSEAKKVLKQEDAEEQMEGIYTSCIPLDEAPDAYKPASEIKGAIGPTAKVVEEIKPIINLKAK